MSALRELLAFFSVDVETGKLEHAHEKIEETKSAAEALGEGFEKLKTVAEGALAAFGIEKIVEGTEAIVQQAVAMRADAAAAGISTDALQQWRNTVELAGGDASSLGFLFKTLSNNAYLASEGSAQAAKAFGALGVHVKDAHGELLPTADLMSSVVEKLAGIENPTKRAALAVETLGRGAMGLLPLLGAGKEGLEEFGKQAEAIGPSFDDDFIKEAQEAKEVTYAFEQRILHLKVALASAFLPVLHLYERTIGPLSEQIAKFLRNQENLATVLKALGIVGLPLLISKLGGLMAILRGVRVLAVEAFLPFAAVAGAILLIQDFIVFLQGGDSVIGAFFTNLAGPGTAKKIRQYLIDKFEEFKAKLEEVKAAGLELWARFKTFLKEHAGQIVALLALYGAVKIALFAIEAAQVAYRAAVALTTIVQEAYTAAVAAGNAVIAIFTTEVDAAAVSAVGLDTALGPLLVTLGAIAAAVGAVYAAWGQLNKLSNETGGLGFTGIVQQMVKQGTFNPFKAVDTYQNQQARAEARLPSASSSSAVTITDQRKTEINISGATSPGATARAVDQTMQRAQAHDRQAIREAF